MIHFSARLHSTFANHSIDLQSYGGISASDEIGHVIEKVVDIARQIILEMDSGGVQELMDSYNQELIMDELIKMHEQQQGIQELES
ncbi:hypothetical protein TNCV_44851 [Trichonephila clavipes]|nr:hypothetical protein TNCV_44851 [Trichonephila clavipes]